MSEAISHCSLRETYSRTFTSEPHPCAIKAISFLVIWRPQAETLPFCVGCVWNVLRETAMTNHIISVTWHKCTKFGSNTLYQTFYTVYSVHDDEANSRITNKCNILLFTRSILHKASTCFGAIISPSSGSWHNFNKNLYTILHCWHHNMCINCDRFIGVCFKEILVSAPWRWPDNNSETCSSCVNINDRIAHLLVLHGLFVP